MLDHNNKEPQFPQIPSLDWDVLFYSGRQGQTVTSSVFCRIKHVFIPISSGSENSSKRTQIMAFSASHRNRVFNASPFPFNKRFCTVLSRLNVAQESSVKEIEKNKLTELDEKQSRRRR